jgi:DNA-binding GntR family transcriptional regulator
VRVLALRGHRLDRRHHLHLDLAGPARLRRLGIEVGHPDHPQPYNINDSYFPLDLAQGTEIMQPGDIARGANQVLAEQGYEQVRAFDEFYIRMPTPEEAHRLDLGPGTPVARHICTGTTADDEPVRVVLNILPGDRHVIVYERAKPYDDDPDPDDPEG